MTLLSLGSFSSMRGHQLGNLASMGSKSTSMDGSSHGHNRIGIISVTFTLSSWSENKVSPSCVHVSLMKSGERTRTVFIETCSAYWAASLTDCSLPVSLDGNEPHTYSNSGASNLSITCWTQAWSRRLNRKYTWYLISLPFAKVDIWKDKACMLNNFYFDSKLFVKLVTCKKAILGSAIFAQQLSKNEFKL